MVKDKNGQSRKSDHDEGETGDCPVRGPVFGARGMITVRGYEGARVGVLRLRRCVLSFGFLFALLIAQPAAACTIGGQPAPIEPTLKAATTLITGRVESASYSFFSVVRSRGGAGRLDIETIRTLRGVEQDTWRLEVIYQNWDVGDGSEPVWEEGRTYLFPIEENREPRTDNRHWSDDLAEYLLPPLPAVVVPACTVLPVFEASEENIAVAKRLSQ